MFKFNKIKNEKTLKDYELTTITIKMEDYLKFIAMDETIAEEDKLNIFVYAGKYLGQDKYITRAIGNGKNRIMLISNVDKIIVEKINY